MFNNKTVIERTIESIRQCLDEGVVLNITFTEHGQIFDFYDLKKELSIDAPETDATYSYERQLDGELIEYTEFNSEFYQDKTSESALKH